jgi:hypothetical protein
LREFNGESVKITSIFTNQGSVDRFLTDIPDGVFVGMVGKVIPDSDVDSYVRSNEDDPQYASRIVPETAPPQFLSNTAWQFSRNYGYSLVDEILHL